MSMIVSPTEFHLSLRVSDLEASTAFYTAFLSVEPKDRTPRFSTFVAPTSISEVANGVPSVRPFL